MEKLQTAESSLHWGRTALFNSHIDKKTAAYLEDRLMENPKDELARATLIGYYSGKQRPAKEVELKRIRHILWTLENAPDCGLGRTPYLAISQRKFPKEWNMAQSIILQQIKRKETSPDTAADLAHFFSKVNPSLAAGILREMHERVKDKTSNAFWLASVLWSWGRASKDQQKLVEATAYMKVYCAESSEHAHLDRRFWLASYALGSAQYDLAREVSEEMLLRCPTDSQSVHTAHTVLGTLALKRNDVQTAIAHLRLAGKVGESPRLCSYGPMMQLARALLKVGYQSEVCDYLLDCKQFWTMGHRQIEHWLGQIDEGKQPRLRGDDI